MIVDLIIPVLNEEASIGLVIRDLPKGIIRHTIVCDNGSIDKTVEVALSSGAIVLHEPKKGYGAACLKGMEYLLHQDIESDIVLFIDGDYSDFPQQATLLL
ncbi:MAG: glycosyltransferase, partial [Saprospiraceae bacterium]